jgi:hypothetical protein
MTMKSFVNTNLPQNKKITIMTNGKLFDDCKISLIKIFSHGIIILYYKNNVDPKLPLASVEINELAELEKKKFGIFPTKFREVRFNGEIIKDFSVIRKFYETEKRALISLFKGENGSLDIRYDYIYFNYPPIFVDDNSDGEFFEVTARTVYAASVIIKYPMRVEILGVQWGNEKNGYNQYYADIIFRGNKKIEIIWANMNTLEEVLNYPFTENILTHPDNNDPILKQFVDRRNALAKSSC